MTRTAFVSDIHANLPALKAVLEDAQAQGAEQFICLGDVVGYGAQPLECLELVREHCGVFLKGNHEEAVIEGPYGFNPFASAAIHWTRDALEAAGDRMPDALVYLATLPERVPLDHILLVHGSPSFPTEEYLFREDTLDYQARRQDYSPKLTRCFKDLDKPCFVGHTHVPGVIDAEFKWVSPEACESRYETRGKPCFVNVGSVGQPRDGDLRASYGLFDGEVLEFRRVEYDVESAARRIFEQPELPDILGQRLLEGW